MISTLPPKIAELKIDVCMSKPRKSRTVMTILLSILSIVTHISMAIPIMYIRRLIHSFSASFSEPVSKPFPST